MLPYQLISVSKIAIWNMLSIIENDANACIVRLMKRTLGILKWNLLQNDMKLCLLAVPFLLNTLAAGLRNK